jgi:hypothetical protein
MPYLFKLSVLLLWRPLRTLNVRSVVTMLDVSVDAQSCSVQFPSMAIHAYTDIVPEDCMCRTKDNVCS